MGATGADCATVALVLDFDDKGKRHVKSLKIRKTLLLPFSLLLFACTEIYAGKKATAHGTTETFMPSDDILTGKGGC